MKFLTDFNNCMRKILVAALPLLFLTSCFTGVEGTRRVVMSKDDIQATLPTVEDDLTAPLKGEDLASWRPGKEFVALDNRAALIFDSRTLPPDPLSLSLKGKTLVYRGSDMRVTPGLDTVRLLIFADSARQYIYPLKRQTVNSLELPMLTDKALIDRFDALLKGKRLWVRNAVWHTGGSMTMQGLKYAPVVITNVTPGSGVYPANIHFKCDGKDTAWLPVSLGNAGPASRSFSHQFSLSDPKEQYPGISDENWNLIQQQRVVTGMTKTEARLSRGNPKDVSQGHNSAMLYELWQYPDGSYMIFEDGLLTRFKIAQ